MLCQNAKNRVGSSDLCRPAPLPSTWVLPWTGPILLAVIVPILLFGPVTPLASGIASEVWAVVVDSISIADKLEQVKESATRMVASSSISIFIWKHVGPHYAFGARYSKPLIMIVQGGQQL